MSSAADEQEELGKRITQFVGITGTSTANAQKYLENNNFSLEDALQEFFDASVTSATSRGLGEVPRPASASSSTSSVPKATKTKKKRIRTFQDITNGTNDSTSEDDDVNLFTGGEKSALQVENPNKNNPANLVQDILRKATDPNNGRPNDSDSAPKKKQFTGTGFKLGDTQTPSTAIPDRTSRVQKLDRVERKITFWKDGFSVGEGRLYRYDDPRNSSYLRDLNSGRAPLELLDVQLGQDVDVNVDKRLEEDYVPPKRKAGGFVGSGQRLGSPVPGDVASPVASPAATTATETAKTEESKPKDEEGEGDTRLQIRLADGRKIIHRFNSTDSVQILYDFVSAETTQSKTFFLSLSFPVKPLEDKTLTLKEAGLLNAAVIQRWA